MLADAAIAILLEEVRECLEKTNFRNLTIDEKYNNECYKMFCDSIQPYDQYNQNQLSFHTIEAIKCLEFKDLEIIKTEGG